MLFSNYNYLKKFTFRKKFSCQRAQVPVNSTRFARERRKGYGMVNRYLRYCMGNDLIRIVSVQKTRGRYPSKTYAPSKKGSKLLAIFDEEKEEEGRRGRMPRGASSGRPAHPT
jgi:hypothetical protein